MWAEYAETMFPNPCILLNGINKQYNSIQELIEDNPPSFSMLSETMRNECWVQTDIITFYPDGTVVREVLESSYPIKIDGISALNAYANKTLTQMKTTQMVFKPRFQVEQLLTNQNCDS